MNKKTSNILFIMGCLVILIIASAIGLLMLSLFSITNQVVENFDPPNPELSYTQNIYLSASLFLCKDTLLHSRSQDNQEQTFHIEPNESTAKILARLSSQGLISDPACLRTYLLYSGLDKKIQPGNHILTSSMSPVEIAKNISSSEGLLYQFTIMPGWRIEEIAAALHASAILDDPQAFINAAKHSPSSFFHQFTDAKYPTLEGLIFPDTYSLQKKTSPDQLISIFLQRFQANLTPTLESQFKEQGLTTYQAIILASVVERESVVKEEMPLIASVFYNRLRAGMKLDSDPTVQYALGYNQIQKTWWSNPLRAEDLQIDSPYNTYLYAGLPPTPICNPSLAALTAVAQPEASDFFYFRASCQKDGRHVFSRTYEEHLKNFCP